MTTDTATSPFRIAIAATFTAEPLRPIFAFWAKHLHASFDIRFAPYNQVTQSLLDPTSELAANSHGVNIILARLEDLGQFEENGAGSLTKLEGNIRSLLDQIRAATPGLSAPLIFCLCPPSPAFIDTPERLSFKKRMNATLSAALDETPGVQLLHYEQIERWYPVDTRHDAEGERLGKIPYTELYYAALGTALIRYTHGLFLPPYKVVALDCDNTLWAGICGEDGPEGVVIDTSRRALQEFMADQRECGFLLTMASKNNEQDVLDTFAAHPEMPLSLRHFVAWRLNWESKAENLLSLAENLDLGIDSFIFVDDNQKECAEVAGALPQVLSLALPEDVARIPEFLKHVWAFDHPVVTEEDRNRNVYYAQQQEFGTEVQRAASLEEFMATLDLRVSIQPLAPARLARVAQLTQRTNQFNLTTIRRSEAEINSLNLDVLTAEVSDRFGDYGLVGVVICGAQGSDLVVDTLLLSCRVLGRGVEHRIASFLGETALSRGLNTVVFRYAQTKKNSPGREFLDEIAGERRDLEGGFELRIPAADLAQLRWKPPPTRQPLAKKASTKVSNIKRSVDYGAIAHRFTSAVAILQAIHSEHQLSESSSQFTETEAKLARIWSELLERTSVTAGDNFFDLGGHSLLAVLLLLRIRETFGIELSIDDVYSGTLTLSDLAARIETAQLGGIDPDEYAALLAEIEGLSDEEARALLASEDQLKA